MPAEAQSTLDVLVKARALIEKPENWGQGSYFDGGRHCAAGAINFIVNTSSSEVPRWELVNRVHRALKGVIRPRKTVVCFNDTHTHAEVLAAFDKAIAAERAKLEAEAV